MLNDITFGQFYPAKSLIHKMDPRFKMVLTVAFIVFTFVSQNAVSLIITGIALGLFIFATRIPVKMFLKTLKPIIPIIILTSILNALYVSGGDVLVSFWKITITTGGVTTAVYMAVRIAILIMCSSILTYTTSPTELTDAIERLFSPLKAIKVDIHSLAMMMTIALRFIPTLIEETDKIMSAQKARGADMESGGIIKRVKALVPILIPLLISSFRRASELADAMECRCYHGGEGRTRMKVMKASAFDYLATAIFALLLAAIIFSNTYCQGIIYSLIKG